MQTIDLFPTQIFKFRIDPNSYNKKELVNILVENYNRDKHRNSWDNNSILHHYYNDWHNNKFEKLPIDPLLKIYDKTILNFIDSIKKKNRIQYHWSLENVTVNAEHMESHDHTGFSEGGFQNTFSAVHYIKFKNGFHQPTNFFNPTMFAQFNGFRNNIMNLLDNQSIENSTYFETWQLETKEDDFIIFPSHLKHNVVSKLNEENHRITGVVNIAWKVQ